MVEIPCIAVVDRVWMVKRDKMERKETQELRGEPTETEVQEMPPAVRVAEVPVG